jgi:hypothetical protein
MMRVWNGFMCLRIGSSGESLWMVFGVHTMWQIHEVVDKLITPQKILYSIKIQSSFFSFVLFHFKLYILVLSLEQYFEVGQHGNWKSNPGVITLTLSLLKSYIYGALCKARNFNIVCIWTYVWQRWKPSLSICCTMFQYWINAESFPVAQLCVNTSPATKITLITDGIYR